MKHANLLERLYDLLEHGQNEKANEELLALERSAAKEEEERNSFDLSPAMVQARNDQLNADIDRLKQINNANVDRLAKICELTGGGGDAVAQVSALKDWKESSMREWRKADIQKLGQLLAIPIGAGVMENLQPRIEGLLAERDQWQRRAEEAERGKAVLRGLHREALDEVTLVRDMYQMPLLSAQAHAVKLRQTGRLVADRLQWAIQFLSEKPFKPWHDAEEWLKYAEPHLDDWKAALAITPAEALREHDLEVAERAFYGGLDCMPDEGTVRYLGLNWKQKLWQASETRRALEESAALNPPTP